MIAPAHASEHEHKYALAPERADAFLAAVAAHLTSKIYDDARPIAYARTTYLDTEDLTYLGSSGTPLARRLRVREYAAAANGDAPGVLTGVCFLELKESGGGRRRKVRLSAPPHVVADMIAHRGVLALHPAILASSPFDALARELAAHAVAPRLTVWYRRRSLASAADRVRITLDTGVTFCQPAPVGARERADERTEIVGHGPDAILEIKHSGTLPPWLADAMAQFGAPERFSKYELGMSALQRRAA